VTGFFGKLPTHGDFVHRELPDVFLNRWDAWLQDVISASQAHLGQHWLDAYLTSPIWRFVLDRDVIDGTAWAGMLMPSVDRVGRYFPFTVATRIDGSDDLARIATAAEPWFAGIESQGLALLDRDVLDLGELLRELPAWPHEAGVPSRETFVDTDRVIGGPWDPTVALAGSVARWADRHARARLAPATLWWSGGSHELGARWRMHRGLPRSDDYVAMLRVNGPASNEARDHRDELAEFQWVLDCAGITHPGHVRRDNQDAWLSRPDIGVWVVADGMGGHRDGAWASQRVVAEIDASLRPRGSVEAVVDDVRRALERVNAQLRARSEEPDASGDMAGSTVVALVVGGLEAVVLWAGDSRAYRVRAGAMEQVTDDHVERSDQGRPASEITRAVGAEDQLSLDMRRVGVTGGDRWLLCSDGVHGQIPDVILAGILGGAGDALAMTAAIQGEGLRGRAGDNLTALVVRVGQAG
jgi:type VI secretion system protein ImpM